MSCVNRNIYKVQRERVNTRIGLLIKHHSLSVITLGLNNNNMKNHVISILIQCTMYSTAFISFPFLKTKCTSPFLQYQHNHTLKILLPSCIALNNKFYNSHLNILSSKTCRQRVFMPETHTVSALL